MGRRDQNRPPKKKVRVPQFPLLENCDTENPEEMAMWALVGLPGLRGAPLPMPEAGLRKVSRRLWDLGFRFHPELRTLKYRKPRAGDPHFLVNPGTWVPIDEPDDEDKTPEQIGKKLSEEQKAALRKQFGLELPEERVKPEDARIPYMHKDGSTTMVTRKDLQRYNNAKRRAAEHVEEQQQNVVKRKDGGELG